MLCTANMLNADRDILEMQMLVDVRFPDNPQTRRNVTVLLTSVPFTVISKYEIPSPIDLDMFLGAGLPYELAGVLIMLCIILVLRKYGFFKRPLRDRLQQEKSEWYMETSDVYDILA